MEINQISKSSFKREVNYSHSVVRRSGMILDSRGYVSFFFLIMWLSLTGTKVGRKGYSIFVEADIFAKFKTRIKPYPRSPTVWEVCKTLWRRIKKYNYNTSFKYWAPTHRLRFWRLVKWCFKIIFNFLIFFFIILIALYKIYISTPFPRIGEYFNFF